MLPFYNFTRKKNQNNQFYRLNLTDTLELKLLYKDEAKRDVFLEFCEQLLEFGGKYEMQSLKLWTLLTIFKEFHKHCCESNLTAKESVPIFKDILLRHSIERPPFSICIFAYADLQPIMKFMIEK